MINDNKICMIILLLVLSILGISIYLSVEIHDLKKHKTMLPMVAQMEKVKKYNMSPGNGYKIVPGGSSNDINMNDCMSCLQSASYDPTDPSANADPAYYYNGGCHYSEEMNAPQAGSTIAVKGVENSSLNQFTCANPGKVSY